MNNNNWVKFLRRYGPIPQNDNMYDEAIIRAIRRTKVEPISFESPYLKDLMTNFNSPAPSSVILTGTAGDGKTYLCREIWENLEGSPTEWASESKIKRISLKNGKSLIVIKDQSELRDEEKIILKDLAFSVTNFNEQIYLIAANDGELMEAWTAIEDSPEISQVKHVIEDALVLGKRNCGDLNLQLYNLSHFRSSDLLFNILDAVCNHSGWQSCEECVYAVTEVGRTCPIWLNLNLLRESIFRMRLRELLLLCDFSNVHMPIRQLLILISNAILGHPYVKDKLMTCTDIPNLIETGKACFGSIYANIFGSNLRLRRLPEIFDILRGFGIGEETSNFIDNMIILGIDNTNKKQRDYFSSFIASDQNYGANDMFLVSQSAYLEGEKPEYEEEFLRSLSMQRQRLFFVATEESKHDLNLWHLSVFHFAGEFIKDVIEQLYRGRQVQRKIIDRLVCGLNRIFSGMLTRTTKDLWLTTSGNFSQARVNKLVEGKISAIPYREESIDIQMNENDMVEMVVNIDNGISVSLPLTLVRYEFLSRVAEGALPSSFSRECYEDILSFKSKVIAKYRELPDPPQSEIILHFVSLDEQSYLQENLIYVTKGDEN